MGGSNHDEQPLDRSSDDQRNTEEAFRRCPEQRRKARDQPLIQRLMKPPGQGGVDAVRGAQSQQTRLVRDQKQRPVRREQGGRVVDRQLEQLVERRRGGQRAAHFGEFHDLLQPVLLGSNEVHGAVTSSMRSPLAPICISRGWRSWATPRAFAIRSVRPKTPPRGWISRKTMLSVMWLSRP